MLSLQELPLVIHVQRRWLSCVDTYLKRLPANSHDARYGVPMKTACPVSAEETPCACRKLRDQLSWERFKHKLVAGSLYESKQLQFLAPLDQADQHICLKSPRAWR